MAFIGVAVLVRTAPKCHARRGGSSSRRNSGQRARTNKPRVKPSRMDPILDDGDIDSTDITTYVSCPICFNSLMLRPEQLVNGPLRVKCNCCDRSTNAAINNLENVDGTLFDVEAWLKNFKAKGRSSGEVSGQVDATDDADIVHLEFADEAVEGEEG